MISSCASFYSRDGPAVALIKKHLHYHNLLRIPSFANTSSPPWYFAPEISFCLPLLYENFHSKIISTICCNQTIIWLLERFPSNKIYLISPTPKRSHIPHENVHTYCKYCGEIFPVTCLEDDVGGAKSVLVR